LKNYERWSIRTEREVYPARMMSFRSAQFMLGEAPWALVIPPIARDALSRAKTMMIDKATQGKTPREQVDRSVARGRLRPASSIETLENRNRNSDQHDDAALDFPCARQV